MVKFGTGGFRAIIGEDFTRDNLELIAQALANKIKAEKAEKYPVIIGYDKRFLSDVAAEWCAQVLAGNGIQVKIIKEATPTPLIMYVVKNWGAKYGMAITASHNPAMYNGVKIFTDGGRDATKEVTDEVESLISGIKSSEIKRKEYDVALNDKSIVLFNAKNEYVDSILKVVDIDKIRERGLKVLVDPMYGVSKSALLTILMTCRCDVDVINDTHDTLFGGQMPSPTAETLLKLRNDVVKGGYDVGIATDGDADRIGLIDANGNYVHPNDILVLLYYYLVNYKGWKGDCVRNLATTHLLDQVAEGFGYKCHEVPVGFKWISEKMQEVDALIGGESSGGLTVRGHIFGKDGIYAAALLIEMISVIGKPLSEIMDDIKKQYGPRYMGEINVSFSHSENERLKNILFVEKKVPTFEYEIEKVSYLDGCKIYFKNGGWIICRFSGTEPIVRIFTEMADEETVNKVNKTMLDFLGL